jgi:hypothetical protein
MAKTNKNQTSAKDNKDAKTSAAPGTKDEKAAKVKKVAFTPIPDGGFKEMPAAFDPKLHTPLKRKDFADESLWFEMKATEHEAKAAAYKKQAADYRKLGSVADRAKAKRLIQMQSKMAELTEQLKSQGVDVDEILGTKDSE